MEKVSMEVVERRMQAWDVESRRERLVREQDGGGAGVDRVLGQLGRGRGRGFDTVLCLIFGGMLEVYGP